MSRTLATLIVAIIASTSFAQVVNQNDPVERMTDRIMRTFMPSAFQAPFSQQPTALRAERVERLQPAEDSRLPQTRRLRTERETPAIDREPALEPIRDPLPEFDFPMPRSFRMFPMMDLAPPSFASGSFSSSRQRLTSTSASLKTAPLPPAPLSLSRASANGIHAIQAVVPTENGSKRLELKGTSAEVRRQVEALPKDIRPIMRKALGY